MAGRVALGGQSYLVLDARAMNELLRGPHGPVMRHAAENAEKVKREAIRTAPRGKGPHGGQLASHILKRAGMIGGDPVWFVGVAGVPYAGFVSRGTPAHIIRGNPYLAFHWEKMGVDVVVRSVHHPGTKPNRYLEDALHILG